MERAVTPVVALVLLIAITVVGAAGVTTVATGLDVRGGGASETTIALAAAADGQRITVSHRGGATLDLRDCSLSIRVDGEALDHQPPVPYFAAEGFRGTPTGAFNSAGDPHFAPGDRASLQLASTNAPRVAVGDPVSAGFRCDGRRVAAARVRAV